MRGAALCINLAHHTDRWRDMSAQAVALPEDLAPLRRVDAVVGRHLDPRDPAIPLSNRCRVRLLERWRVCNGLYVNSTGAVGATLSHVRCLDWLLAQPADACAYALILEDDCCLARDFRTTWEREVRPLLLTGDIDWAVLGYMTSSLGHFPTRLRADGRGYTSLDFLGAHCYVVTRAGAAALRATVFPIQLHFDKFLAATLATQQRDSPRALVWRTPLAHQCRFWQPSSIGHRDGELGVLSFLPDLPTVQGVLLILGVVVVTACLVAVQRGKGQPGG